MSDIPENDLPGLTLESEKLVEIKQCLVEAERELQTYQCAQLDPFHSQAVNSTRLQSVVNNLQMAIHSLTYLDSIQPIGGKPPSSSVGLNHESERKEQGFPSVDYLKSLRKWAEQTAIGSVPDLKSLSNEEIQLAFHELEVHQVELRMQNEELLRVQIELETSRDRFSSLYDFAPVGYCTINKKGIILEANATLHRLLHMPERALINTNIQHYIQEQEQDRFYLYHRAAIKGSSTQRCELMMGTAENNRFIAQLESRITPGRSNHLWLVVSDISNSRRAAEFTARYEAVVTTLAMLEIERNRYRGLFESVPDGYFVTDDMGIILDVNLAGAALVGSTKEQLVGKALPHYVLPDAQPAFINRMNSILLMHTAGSSNNPDEWEVQIQSGKGAPSTVIVSAVLLHEKTDNEVRIRWLIEDITLKKQTEAALQESDTRFHALFKESLIGIRLFDLQGNTITSNGAIQEILGYNGEELRQMPFTQLTDPLDQKQEEELFRSILSGEIDRYTIEKRCIRKDRQQVWVHQVVFLVRDVANAASFFVSMTEDISERKQMELELVEVKRHLIDAPEAERLMLSQDLHDGPMQDLYGVFYNIKSLEGRLSGEDAEIVSSSAITINQVVHILRGFAGQLRPPTLKSYGLEKTIRSHAEQFQEDHPEIFLTLDLMPDGNKLPERVSLALFRIYQQSLANILRHAHATRVNIRLILDDQHVQLGIEDNGAGFEVPSRLVDLIRNGHYGLVGSAERAEAIGGTLTIDSQPGRGTTIFVDVNLTMTPL
jgi:two-component system, NarL family, sensor histidine kinase UhpB